MKRIALTGATGLVGSRIVELLQNRYEFLPISRTELDITNREDVSRYIAEKDFDLFLHLAAYTNVDRAEEEPDTAELLNAGATRFLHEAVSKKAKPFIYFSTDFVFDGEIPPFTETSDRHAISMYGRSKADGEAAIEGKAMIVRIAYPYRSVFTPKKDFVRSLRDLMKAGTSLTMVNDMLMTPTFIDDIAHAMPYLLENWKPEIFHVVGSNSLSPYECARAIARAWNLDESLVKSTTYAAFFAGKARRPKNSRIINTKLPDVKTRMFEEGLEEMKRQES